jgi:hypothetical protein
VDQGQPVGSEPVTHIEKIGRQIGRADMFEHAHRDRPVKGFCHLAVIDQFKPDPVADPQDLRPASGDRQLPFRQGDADHLDIGDMGEVQCKPAPSAADIEQPMAVFQAQLGRDR